MSLDLRHARLAMTTEPVQLDHDAEVGPGLTPPVRQSLFEQMVLNRVFETEAERQYKAARIGGYCHLSSGQEATTAGAVHALDDDDLLVTGYRCHGFALARGLSPATVMAELFGRSDGCSHGRGGSMHLQDVSRGFYGGWGIVAGQLPVATGLALALVRQHQRQAVLCELGDGAVNIGAWHESLNLAALWDLPVVFLVVNNGYGMGTAVERASAEPEIYKRASAFRMHGERVDGDDLDAVVEAADRLLRAAREERRPAVLEAITYRFRGHSVADGGVAYRSKSEIAEHTARDPIARVRERLLADGLEEAELEAIADGAEALVAAAVESALASPEPPTDRLAWGVHAQGSDAQFARMRPGSAFGEEKLVFDSGLGT
jgi:pyruvate dehydrogenase E1 component alpha subunit